MWQWEILCFYCQKPSVILNNVHCNSLNISRVCICNTSNRCLGYCYILISTTVIISIFGGGVVVTIIDIFSGIRVYYKHLCFYSIIHFYCFKVVPRHASIQTCISILAYASIQGNMVEPVYEYLPIALTRKFSSFERENTLKLVNFLTYVVDSSR